MSDRFVNRAGADGPAELVFIGGTGRSGTHILSYLLDRHSRFHGVPIECRFHCNPKGLADLVMGRTDPDDFLRKLRGYWWHRVRIGDRAYVRAKWRALGRGRDRGLHTILDPESFNRAADQFERTHADDLPAASRTLFYELLQPGAERAGKPVLVEMSCFTIAAADGLARIFPEARFVHSVRDGRDSGSSKVALRQKRHHPIDVASGIEFWVDRLRQAERGVRGLSPADRERLHVVSLDELVQSDREASYAELRRFLGVDDEPPMREFFETEMNADAAHRERWRKGLNEGEQEHVVDLYEAALAQLEADGYHCAPVLRRSYERTLAAYGH
jgi:Sulfotransferase family